MNWYKTARQDYEIQKQIQLLRDSLKSQHPGLELDLWYAHNHYIELARIELPPEMQNQGFGHQIIKDIQEFARQLNVPIVLRPEAEKRKKTSLNRFYRDLDFVPNKGRSADPTLSSPFASTMYWKPENELV